jgi:hypothetical protein
MMKTFLITFMLLPLFLSAQKEIEISEDYTTVMIFPSEIEEPILGNQQEYFIKESPNRSQIGKRTIRLGYIKVDKVEKNTNLTVFTKDGNSYEYLLKYKKTPEQLTHYINSDESQMNLLEISDQVQATKTPEIVKAPGSHYSEDVETINSPSTKAVKEETVDDSLYITDKTAYINEKCAAVNDEPRRILRTFDASSNVKLTLKQVSYAKDEIYFHLLLENKGGQAYDVDFINSKLARGYRGSGTDQSIPLTPLLVYNNPERVMGNTGHDFIMVFKKFSINDKKELQIDLAEKNGERNLLLRINNKLINNPVKI